MKIRIKKDNATSVEIQKKLIAGRNITITENEDKTADLIEASGGGSSNFKLKQYKKIVYTLDEFYSDSSITKTILDGFGGDSDFVNNYGKNDNKILINIKAIDSNNNITFNNNYVVDFDDEYKSDKHDEMFMWEGDEAWSNDLYFEYGYLQNIITPPTGWAQSYNTAKVEIMVLAVMEVE